MSLLSPWMLYGLGMLSVPVLIHLWQRRRVVQVHFSTLRFLKIVAARTSRSSRIENVLLLVLRCLIFALLILAAARPVISTKAAKLFGGDVPRTVVLAIDNSMSMGYRTGDQTRLDVAKKQALNVLDDLKPGDDVAVMSVDDRAQLLVAEPTLDHRIVRQMIESIRPGEARSDFSVVFRQAAKIVARGSHGMRELYFFTDNQEGGWHFDPTTVFDDVWTKSELHPVIVQPDDLAAANSAVEEIKIKAPYVTPGDLFAGTAVVVNHSSHASQELLEIKFGEKRVAQKPLDLPPGESVEVPFEFTAPVAAGRWEKIVASIEGDNLPADDQFYSAIPVYQPPHVLIAEGQQSGDERLHSGYFLRKALGAGESDGASIQAVPVSALDDTALESYSAVYLADIPGLSDRALVRLETFLQGGGTVVLFPGDLSNTQGLSRIDFLPAKPQGIRDLPAGRLATHITEPENPLFANAWDADTPFPALPQRRIMEWKLTAGAKALVMFSNNAPFLIFASHWPGRAIIVNASPDRAWGDFPLSPAFLPLVQQIARLSAAQSGKHTNFATGDPLPAAASLPKDEALIVKYPDGTPHDIAAGDRSQLLDRTEQSGFYEVSSAKAGVLQLLAVNADRRESNLKTIAPAALSKIVPNETVAGLDNLKLWLARSRGNVPLWPLLLVLALAVFAAEGILSNIMARNRAQGDTTEIKTGRLNKRRFGLTFRPAATETKA